MNQKSEDLHGNAPDSSPVALLIIDMINDLEFPEGPDFLEPTLAAANQIATLKQRAKAAGIPVVYVNDNFGKWRSNIDDLLNHFQPIQCPHRHCDTPGVMALSL